MQDLKIAVVIPVYNETLIQATLQALYEQETVPHTVHYFVVDNGSTDNTKELVDEFSKNHTDFPLTILTEAEKGTGSASDTAFREAIRQGYTVIARTDGDTQPFPDWLKRISNHFENEQYPHLLGGQSLALRDIDYRPIDSWLTPASSTASRWIFAGINRNISLRKLARGCNMATTARTYVSVGGFPRSSMHERDEDVDYSVKVIKKYGTRSVVIDPKILVRTSSRRFRRLGLLGVTFYYLFPAKRLQHKVDVR